MESKWVYITKDGKFFDSHEEAVEHEEVLDFIEFAEDLGISCTHKDLTTLSKALKRRYSMYEKEGYTPKAKEEASDESAE
jgi:hypothetical protein